MLNQLIIFSAQYLYYLVIAIYVVYFFAISKQDRKNLALLSAIALPLIYLVSKIPGFFYYDPRPFVVNHFIPLIPHGADNGFPSDHTLLTGAIAAVIFFYNKKISMVLWIITFIVGVARVLTGVHHWVDIFGAMTISIVGATLVEQFLLKSKTLNYKK